MKTALPCALTDNVNRKLNMWPSEVKKPKENIDETISTKSNEEDSSDQEYEVFSMKKRTLCDISFTRKYNRWMYYWNGIYEEGNLLHCYHFDIVFELL